MDDLKTKIIFLAMIIFSARIIAARVYDPSIYRGPWYSARIPAGWEKKVEGDEVFFRSPDKDYLGNPNAIFSIYGFQSRGALFLEDFFPEILQNLAQQPGKILDHGEIMIDRQISRWTLFRTEKPKWIIWTFYVVDDYNRLTKIQLMTKPEDFQKYRPVFEIFKNSIRIQGF